jgi:hypothetical protein
LRTRHDVAHTLYPAALGLLFLAVPAVAQTPGQRIIMEQSRQRRARRAGYAFKAPSTSSWRADGGEREAQKLARSGARTVYEMAARECDLLREVIAKDCRMEQVSNNINRQYGNQQQEGFTHHRLDELSDHAEIA